MSLRRERKGRGAPLVNGVLLLLIATICSLAALYPHDVLAAFGLEERHFFLPLLLGAVLAAAVFFLALIWLLGARLLRRARGLRSLPASAQATVAVEYMLVIPLVMYLFCTIFAMAEIAHAQLVFRYAAFSAARAGAVSKSFLHWPPHIGSDLMIYSIADSDKKRMRAAAVSVLAGIDGHAFGQSGSSPLADFSSDGLAACYFTAGQHKPDWPLKKGPWPDKALYSRQFSDADKALVDFKTRCEYSKLFNRPPSDMIKDLIKTYLSGKIDPNPSDDSGWLAKLLAQIQKEILQGLLSPINSLIDLLLKKSGIEDILVKLPNPVTPPMVSVQMRYELRLRPASLFWLMSPNGKNGYPCLTLRRNANSTDNSPLLMQTTGGRVDMPLIPPLIKKVNFMFGDSTY